MAPQLDREDAPGWRSPWTVVVAAALGIAVAAAPGYPVGVFMRRRLRGVVALAVAGCAIGMPAYGLCDPRPMHAQPGSNTGIAPMPTPAEQVLAADDRRLAANMSGDVAALARLLDDDFTYTHYTGFREGREPYLDRIRKGEVSYLDMRRLAGSVRMIGDVALVDGEALMTVQRKGLAAVTIRTLYLAVWVRRHGEWRITAYASTLAT